MQNQQKTVQQEIVTDLKTKQDNSSLNCINSPELQTQVNTSQATKKITLKDFNIICQLGKGSFGEVILAEKIDTSEKFAIKVIDKHFLAKNNKEYQVLIEREVLLRLNHPNVIQLYSSFQDRNKLYFVLEYSEGGEFSEFLKNNKNLDLDLLRFYAAEIVNIIDYLHSQGIAHRDLKPNNLILTKNGHLKVIDFGTAKFFKNETVESDLYKSMTKLQQNMEIDNTCDSYKSTFVGTAEYVSPEMLEDCENGPSSDLWALGCILYEIYCGVTPFRSQNEYQTFQKIKSCFYQLPKEMPESLKDLINQLLKRNPNQRIGAETTNSLKNHAFFSGINFNCLTINNIESKLKKQNYNKMPDDLELSYLCQQRNSSYCESSFYSSRNSSMFSCSDLFASSKNNTNTVILQDIVLKKCGWIFYKPRLLVLTNLARIYYYDPQTNQIKGEIKLLKEVKSELIDKSKWIIKIPKRIYYFKFCKESNGSKICCEEWVTKINQIIQQIN